jgi:hypothetical protein
MKLDIMVREIWGYMNFGPNKIFFDGKIGTPSPLHLFRTGPKVRAEYSLGKVRAENSLDRKSGSKIPWAASPSRKFLGPQVRAENSLGRKSEPKIPWAESPGRKFLGPKVRAENSLGRNSGLPKFND